MIKDKDLNAWLARMQADSGEKIKGSKVFAGIYTEAALKDPAVALQLGYAIMLDKPIFLLAGKDQVLSKSLERAADHIERVDFKDPADMKRGSEAIATFLKKMEAN